MSGLVDDLLLLARLDEGRPLAREPLDFGEVVGDAVETARAVEPERSIELEAAPAAVVGDRDRLRQLVDNLLGNVRSHTPPGSPVRVRVGSQDGRVVLEVADSGPGLAAEDAERVFERFFRADPSRARASGGVGLGLSIVAAVAQAHAGDVSVRSAPGDGAVFRVELPSSARGPDPHAGADPGPRDDR
jgi:two-component system OmpR family sensor kinase